MLCVCVSAALAIPFHPQLCVCVIYGTEFIFPFLLLFKKGYFYIIKKYMIFYVFLFFGVDCLEGYSLRDDGFKGRTV